jgi:opacity protein-like surface antigen
MNESLTREKRLMMREIRTLITGMILIVGTLAFAPATSQADEIPPPEDDPYVSDQAGEVPPPEEEEVPPPDDNPYDRNGFYLGLAGAIGVDAEAEEELEDQSGLHLRVKEDIGLQARAGYRFHPRVAVEYQFEWITDADIDVQAVPFGDDAFQIERWTSTANAKLYLATESVQPFLLVGLGVLTVEIDGSPVEVAPGEFVGLSVDETDFAARFGGGIEIYATEHIVIDLNSSYVLPTGNLDDYDYWSVGWGFQYRF